MIPFLKWPGGKRWFVQKCPDIFPKDFERYVEPFLGSGSVYFHLQPKRALLADSNPHLIAAYSGIKRDWARLEKALELHHENHSDEYYYQIRDWDPPDLVNQASRLIYLNRTCFNGIYRTNLQGQFNVPRGDRDQVIRDTDDFEGVAKLLGGAEIRVSDFEATIDEAGEGDFIFADPPYTVRHNLNGFVRYNETLFSWEDQERLFRALDRARRRNVKIVSTNADHNSVKALYRDKGFTLRPISRFSAISATKDSRKKFTELLICANT
jgi:DNA adenine methylase